MGSIVKLFFLLLITSVFIGCGGEKPQPTMPKWYLSAPSSDLNYFYGVGEGSTKESANAKALAQISATISTTIESKIELNETDSTQNGYNEETKSNIKSSTDKIKFSGITPIETKYINHTFYTYLKVDRKVLFNSLKRDLDKRYNKASLLFKQMKIEGAFSILKNSPKLSKMLHNLLTQSTLEILKSVNPKFDSMKYRAKIIALQTALEDKKSQLVLSVKSKNKLSSYYRDIVKKYISSYGLTMINNPNKVKNKADLLDVDVSVKAKRKDVKTSDPRLRGAYFSAVTVVLTTKNSSGKIVAQNRIDLLNISKESLQSAKVKTKKFENKIKKIGILNILSKTNK